MPKSPLEQRNEEDEEYEEETRQARIEERRRERCPTIIADKQGTNSEFVAALMEDGNPMNQMVIIQALGSYFDHFTEDTEKPANWSNMINWEAWKASALNMKAQYDEKYGK